MYQNYLLESKREKQAEVIDVLTLSESELPGPAIRTVT